MGQRTVSLATQRVWRDTLRYAVDAAWYSRRELFALELSGVWVGIGWEAAHAAAVKLEQSGEYRRIVIRVAE